MNAYSISRLAEDAGVSVHIARDYVLRGLESGIGLDELARLCRALDADDSTDVIGCIERLLRQIATRQAALAAVKTELAGLTHHAIEGHTHA